VVVLASTPGLVPLAAEVAKALQAPLDLFLLEPLVLAQPRRLEVGAVASGGVLVLDPQIVRAHAVSVASVAEAARTSAWALARLEASYRGEHDEHDLRSQKVIVVVDGRASLFALRMTVAALNRRWVDRVVLASPSMTEATCRALLDETDEVVTALTPELTPDEVATASLAPELAPADIASFLRQCAASSRSDQSRRDGNLRAACETVR
jgi:putative phosphoribosyl transferase